MHFLPRRDKDSKSDTYSITPLNIMHEAKGKKITSGTKEWADHNVNLIDGCIHDCTYCYAKKMAIRFGRKTASTWKDMIIRQHDVDKGYGKKTGRIMFPTSHDIVPIEPYFKSCMIVLEKILVAGNNVLVTTKPHLRVVEYICNELIKYKDQIQFRFTITSMNDDLLAKWEPGAPKFQERFDSLKYAFYAKYKTSISIEPCLEPDPRKLINTLRPFVTESIWLGIINYSGQHEFNSITTIKNWIAWFKSDSIIRFKDSISKRMQIS